MKLVAGARTIEFPRRPLVMGIVNINDDSFSGDGTLDAGEALRQAERMVADGADVIDVGAESARTNRAAIGVGEEIGRLSAFVSEFQERRDRFAPWDDQQVWPPLLSINTWRPEVVGEILPRSGEILNDMGALPDIRNATACAQTGAALLIMHSVGAPKEPRTTQTYPDVMAALGGFFEAKIAAARAAGVAFDQIIVDPGIGFAKQCEDDLRIYAELGQLMSFGRPILLPVSRKAVIGEVLGIDDVSKRDAGTIACAVAGYLRGGSIFRVHNVGAAAKALKIVHAVETAEA